MAKNGKRVAEHALLDAQGDEIDDDAMENAVGYSFTRIGLPDAFEWQYSEATEDEKRMFCLLGVKTKATNTASGIRNDKKNPGSPSDEMAAVREHFERVRTTGKWLGERAGFSWDHDTLGDAVIEVLTAVGLPASDADATRSAVIAECAASPDGVKKYLNVDGVEAAYRRLKGRKTISPAELLARLSHT